MTKLLHVLTDSNIGGAGHHLLALLDKENGINRKKFDVTVALPENAKLLPSLLAQNINCVQLPHLAENSFSCAAVKILRREMAEYKPDIVHTHAALSGRVAAKIYGKCKIVYTRHSVFEPSGWQQRPPAKWVFGLLNNMLSHRIIAVSPAAKDNLLALGTSAKKIHVIYNGMPPSREYTTAEQAQLREKYNIPKNAFVLAQIARLTEVKGHDDVLDAVKPLTQTLPSVLVLIAGDGEHRAHLEQRIKNENITNVRLLGFVHEVEEILAIMDAGLSASFGTEATSLALVQGMSVGKPAIVTDYGGNPYVISPEKNGLVTPTRKPDALRDAIVKLQSDTKLYRQMCQQAKGTYRERFTIHEMIRKTEELYNELT